MADREADTQATALTSSDVARLMKNPSGGNRAEMAGKIAAGVEAGSLSPKERVIAEEIFRVMVEDAEVRVRMALAQNLKNVPDLSVDIVQSLATDTADAVAVPMLTNSGALSDEELLAIIDGGEENRQIAVARREELSETVSGVLVESGNEEAVIALVGNDGAHLTEKSLNQVVDRYGENERVQRPMVHRSQLPMAIAERLVATVSDQLKEHLVTHHELPPALAADLVLESRERAVVDILTEGTRGDVHELVAQMESSGRLTGSLILRALCTGDLSFFEAALACKADVPLENVRILIHDEGELGFRSLYEKATLPDRSFQAFRAAVDIAKELETERDDKDPQARARLIMERILTQFEDPLQAYDSDDVEYLLGRLMQSFDAETAKHA
ncbi:MAG TPA: hypothetical protein DCS82_08990 [Rhodospirillaceae bacterium]|nr:hypothetical protein [Rhodospirillaceae bacterium]HAT35838.1 hypothetical protein [Rhodospirillaceae bacterium]